MKHILLIEDNPPDAKAVTRYLCSMPIQCRVHLVSDGIAALSYLQQLVISETDPPPDLVLMDLDLPGISGYDLIGHIKGDPTLRCTPLVVLSGSESQDDVVRCYAAGANAYLVKPGSPERFRRLADTIHSMWFDLGRTP